MIKKNLILIICLNFAHVGYTQKTAIEELVKCNWLDQACKNIVGLNMYEDLRQEFFLHLVDNDKVDFSKIMHLQRWTVRNLIMIAQPKKVGGRLYDTKFLKRHSSNGNISVELIGQVKAETHEYKQYENDFHNLCADVLGSLPYYDRVLFILHADGMSYTKIQEHTKITRQEVSRSISGTKTKIKKAWRQYTTSL